MRVSTVSFQHPIHNNISHKGMQKALRYGLVTACILAGSTYLVAGSSPFKKFEPSLIIGGALISTLGGGFGYFYDEFNKQEKKNAERSNKNLKK